MRKLLLRPRVFFAALVVILCAGIFQLGPTGMQANEPVKDVAADLGYGAAFERELARIGPISKDEFGKRYAGRITYLPKLDWDPAQAVFFDRFNLDPKDPQAKARARGAEEAMLREHHKRQGKPLAADAPVMVAVHGGYDFRLNDAELKKFREHGFVVCERMHAPSCTDLYYRVYKRDLPVLITSDSVLHAWHRSYDVLLGEVETTILIPALDYLLSGMSAEVARAHKEYGAGLLRDGLTDADYFLAVARRLLNGEEEKSALGQDDRVERTIEACRLERAGTWELFGRQRLVDFSQFKPRGRYESSPALKRYFQAMMWCGRIDLRVAGNPKESSPRELAAAVVLYDLLQKSGQLEEWRKCDRLLQTFVGRPDSMTLAELGDVLSAAGVRSTADLKDASELTALQHRIAAGKLGAQEIRGDFYYTDPDQPGRLVLPRSVTFLGQRFALDSWALSKLVYDDIHWEGKDVMRRVPTCLDVSFSVFGNDQAAPLLYSRLTNREGHRFRDGLNYQHNLVAVRDVIDAHFKASPQPNLYTGWLGLLRELSRPTTGEEYPQAMRTRAWAMKTLNTQHASWTQLRHDTVLHVKQSMTGIPGCYYPAGYVEPVPQFWGRLEQMAAQAATLIDKAPHPTPAKQSRQVKFLQSFSGTMKVLREIAVKELAQEPLTKEETKFLEDVISTRHEKIGSGAFLRLEGWYPALFYGGIEDSRKWDALVADVHTDPPAPEVGDPGAVLHQAAGNIDLLLLAVDSGPDRMMYAGPVLSHYEFELSGVARQSDAEFCKQLQAGKSPQRPDWTSDYLVPGKNVEVRTYHRE